MCSSPRAPLAALAIALATLVGSSGCGHKDDPKPPPQRIPAPITDLRVTQRGDQLRVSFTYPQVTISGLPIDDVAAIEIWEYEMAVPDLILPSEDEDELLDAIAPAEPDAEGEDDGDADEAIVLTVEEDVVEDADEAPEGDAAQEGEEGESDESDEDTEDTGDTEGEEGDDDDDDEPRTPAVAKESLLELDAREFIAASKLRLRLEGEELSKALRGDKVELELPVGEVEPGEKKALVLGVKSFQSLKRASAFSNVAKIIPRITPEPPDDLELEPVFNGVKLTWTFEGEEPLEFRFYRRDELNPRFDEHFGFQTGDEDRFLDASAEVGNRYGYAMTVVIHKAPLVESALSEVREIDYVDTFPPAPPTDLVVLSEVGTARLLWETSDDPDVSGYLVFRRMGAGEFARLTEEPIASSEYIDTEAASGRTYAYRVVAVDRAGNMSEPSEEVEALIP